MEEKNQTNSHSVSIKNREHCFLTGVESVVAFDEKQIVLETQLGNLTITGSNLRIFGFDDKKKELSLEGNVEGMKYTASANPGKITKGIVSRMFR